jgi:MFS family permease
MAAGRRDRSSWLHVWILVWLACLTIPTIEVWQGASAQHGVDEFAPRWAGATQLALALVTVVLGFAIGWQRRWAVLCLAVILGALVMAIAGWVDATHGWSESYGSVGDGPLPAPFQFVAWCVVLGVLLGFGAGAAAVAGGARHRLHSRRMDSAV